MKEDEKTTEREKEIKEYDLLLEAEEVIKKLNEEYRKLQKHLETTERREHESIFSF